MLRTLSHYAASCSGTVAAVSGSGITQQLLVLPGVA
jgi:hypothetical protein